MTSHEDRAREALACDNYGAHACRRNVLPTGISTGPVQHAPECPARHRPAMVAALEAVEAECKAEAAALRARIEGREWRCCYCGASVKREPDAKQHESVTEHIDVCEKHPIREWRELAQKLAGALKAERAEFGCLCSDFEAPSGITPNPECVICPALAAAREKGISV